jgi:hypothetical protein
MSRLTALALFIALAVPRVWAQNIGEAASAASHATGFNSAASAVTSVGVTPLAPLAMPVSGPTAVLGSAQAMPLSAAPVASAAPPSAVTPVAAAARQVFAPAAKSAAPALPAAAAFAPSADFNSAAGVAPAPDLAAQFAPAANDATHPAQVSEDAGRKMFDGAQAPPEIGNLFARANQATGQQRVKVQAILDTVKSRPLFVDTNILRMATNGDPQWLYFFNKARHVEITPQVSQEYSYTGAMSGRVQADALYRREKLFTKSLGPRLTEVQPPPQERRDALVEYLMNAGISLKDSRMVAEAALSSEGQVSYLLTHDVRLANAVDNMTHSPRLKQRFNAFMATQRAADPDFPEIRFPSILVAPKP